MLVQMAIARNKPELNRAKVLALTANLKPAKPGLLVLPELFSTGYLDEAALKPEGQSLSEVARADRTFFADLARKLSCWVAGATVEAGPRGPDGNGGYRNTSLLFAPDGSESAAYRKVHPFSYGGEDRLFARGNETVTYEVEGWTVQPTICYDLRFPELYRAGSLRGVHLILVQANWPSARQQHWETLLRARAIENQAFVAGVNCVGSQDALRYSGGSAVIGPKGETLSQGDESESVVKAPLDLDHCKQWRKQFPALRDRMPPDFYRL